MSDISGQIVKGYEIRERVGEGGFGAVYRAFQPVVGREVAIKVILPEFANQPDFIRRFEFEAHLIARLEHPFIVPLYDYWREPDGAYLVMRWFGANLRGALRNGPWTPQEVARLLDQVATALNVAHRHKIVHRDIKPDNILLDGDRNAFLADFGIAQSPDDPGSGNAITGSLAYITPEQLKNETVTPQTDQYSLGIVLYELLTGKKPFADTLTLTSLIDSQLETPLPSLDLYRADLPTGLNDVIQRATAKNPLRRFADVLSLASAFKQAAFADQSPIQIEAMVEAENPYKGLRAFHEADAADFFGREVLVDKLLERMVQSDGRFLAVIGPSGSGKSSVVRAGLVPRLRGGAIPGSECWFIIEMLPGTHPLEELSVSLLRIAMDRTDSLLEQLSANENGLADTIKRILPDDDMIQLVLIIDQFEEIFTLLDDEVVRVHFLNNLLNATRMLGSRLRVIITLRADFMHRPLQYAEFGELIRQHNEFVLPLPPNELREAITRPAQRVGVGFEPDLLAAIMKDVAEQPGALPLMQYALTDLFDRREGQILTLKGYRASGGVLGALGNRAEELYSGLNADEQNAARQLFLRLVTLGEGTDDTRRRVERAELTSLSGDSRALETVIDRFGRSRLLTFDHNPATRGPTLEVAHEALIRTWTRLHRWLTDNREELRIQRRLMASAAEWINAGRERSFLASGARLDQFEEWAKITTLGLTADEAQYLQDSIAERQTLQIQDATRRERETRTERLVTTFRRAAIILGVVGLVAIGAIFTLAFQVSNAQNLFSHASTAVSTSQTQVALVGQTLTPIPVTLTAVGSRIQASRTTMELLRLASESDKILLANNGNVETAALLSIRALNTGYLPQADAALRQAIEHAYTKSIYQGHTDAVYSVAYSPDGKYVLTGSADGTAELHDALTEQLIRTFSGHTNAVYSVAYSPDGKYVLTGSKDETARLWDVQTGRTVRVFKTRISPEYNPGHNGPINVVGFSPDGKYVITASRDQTALLWDIQTGESVRAFFGPQTGIFSMAFSPDGKYLVTGGSKASLFLWDVATAKLIRTFTGHTSSVWSVAFSPDSKYLLSGSDDTTARLWNVQTGENVHTFSGHVSAVNGVAYSSDGKYVVTGSNDGTARLWNVETGESIRTFSGHASSIWSVAFSPDGRYVLTGSDDHTARLWNTLTADNPFIFAQHSSTVWAAVFSPDGKYILTGSDDQTAKIWDVQTRAELHTFKEVGPVFSVAFSPDRKTVITGSNDNSPRQWNIDSGKLIHAFSALTHTDAIYALAFSNDGKYLLSGGNDTTMRLWDIQMGSPLLSFIGHTQPVSSIALSPDGKYIVTGSYDHTARIWSFFTGSLIRTLTGHTDTVSDVAFSPDGKTILTGSNDTTARLWDFQTGQVIRTFSGHSNAVSSVAFSPDGNTILTGSSDATARLWDFQTGESLRTFSGHTGAITSVAFSPDGKTILTSSVDNTVRLWQANYRDFIAYACTRVSRDFTDDERLRFGIADKLPTCPQFKVALATPTATP